MPRNPRQQLKDYARTLYLRESLTQAEIAERAGVARTTIVRWAAEGHWEELRTTMSMTTEEQIRNFQRQIAEINETILGREQGRRFANAREADTIVKLTTAVNRLQTEAGIHDIVNVGAAFIHFLRPMDLEKTKEFARLFDAFIKSKIERR